MKKITKLIKKRYRFFIGMLLGILVSASGVYAISEFNSNNVYYDNSNSDLVSKNVQDAIDELASREITGCPDFLICKAKPAPVNLGDYINYTPPTTSFKTDTSYTGYSSQQYIKPSELTSWRVISKNEDGTVDIVSEYVSSTDVYFYGSTGFKNFVLELRRLADAYKDDGTLIYSARPFGYFNQADTCSPSSSNSYCNDTGYITDFNLVNRVLGTRVANKVGKSTATKYWMASRSYVSSGRNYYFVRYVDTSGSVGTESGQIYDDRGSSYYFNCSASLRIILTLKSGLKYTSAGENTWNISA